MYWRRDGAETRIAHPPRRIFWDKMKSVFIGRRARATQVVVHRKTTQDWIPNRSSIKSRSSGRPRTQSQSTSWDLIRRKFHSLAGCLFPAHTLIIPRRHTTTTTSSGSVLLLRWAGWRCKRRRWMHLVWWRLEHAHTTKIYRRIYL